MVTKPTTRATRATRTTTLTTNSIYHKSFFGLVMTLVVGMAYENGYHSFWMMVR
jgi:hypothetical protein